MNRFFKFIFLTIELVSCYLLVSGILPFECVIQKHFHIACPACGMTRAFREIFKLNLIGALEYNLLSILVLGLIILVDYYLIYDILLGRKKLEALLEKLGKHIVPILIILGINMVINNIRGI